MVMAEESDQRIGGSERSPAHRPLDYLFLFLSDRAELHPPARGEDADSRLAFLIPKHMAKTALLLSYLCVPTTL